MNPIKIEKGAIEALKRPIRLHDKMNDLLKEDDKEPSWDGDIYLYNSNDLKSEHIQCRVPVQVKGKNDGKLLKRNSITYPVEYKNLRNYFNDGGVCYFVIAISDDGEKNAIFYNALTPIKLQALLKGTEKKKPGQTKNITLMRLKNNDKNALYRILLQFGHDSKEQGTGELVRKSIALKDMEKIDSIRVTSFISDREETLKNVASGEICLFGHLQGTDIWLPFSYDMQRQIEMCECVKREESFGIDGVAYYNNFEVRKNADNTMNIELSENLMINISKSKVNFVPRSELEQIVKDIRFLEAMNQGKALYIGNKKLCEYANPVWDDELKKTISDFKIIQLAVGKFGISLNKRIDDFTEDDWKSLNELERLYQGKIKPNKDFSWYMWWWQGNVVPFFIVLDDNGETLVENAVSFKKLRIILRDESEQEFQIPAFAAFKRDVWEKLYDVDESILLNELEKSEFNMLTEGKVSSMFVELLAAYDITKNEKYYDMAKLISNKLLDVSPQNEYWIINKLQLLKRKRELSEEELQELEKIEEQTKDKQVICAANILLDNKRKAHKKIEELSKEEKEVFMNYPIYNLL